MALKKETDIWMYLISYATSSNNLAAEERQRKTTTTEYFTKKSVKVQADKERQVKIGVTEGSCILEIREVSKREQENKRW